MATLLLRLAGPLQSWGSPCHFTTRRTFSEPTKSGVIGMIASAMGIQREDEAAINELTKLRFGVRVDREGKLLVDFHTLRLPKKPAEEKDPDLNPELDPIYLSYRDWDTWPTQVTRRHYLQDAVFLAGIESDDTDLLSKIAEAIKAPAHPLFLGRRSCPPSLPPYIGIRDTDLRTTLEEEPVLCKTDVEKLRIMVDTDADDPNAGSQKDIPISFDPRHREYGYRAVRQYTIPTPYEPEKATEPDIED